MEKVDAKFLRPRCEIAVKNSHKFIKELGKMTCEKPMEKRSSSFIMQSISMEVQRSNVACITATVDSSNLPNELFELFHTNED